MSANLHQGGPPETWCKPAGTEVLTSAVAHNHHTAIPGGAERHHCEYPHGAPLLHALPALEAYTQQPGLWLACESLVLALLPGQARGAGPVDLAFAWWATTGTTPAQGMACYCSTARPRSRMAQAAATTIINNNRRLVTLAEHTSDHGKQTNSSTKDKGEQS